MKRCPRCGQSMPLESFVRNRSQPDGLGTYCKTCHNDIGRVNRAKRWGGTRYYHLKARYGLSKAAYDDLWEVQGGKCAICLSVPPAHVDHDHVTGRVRGLLCFNCNGGLGQFRDDSMRLALAISYLQRPAPEAIDTGMFSEGAQG